jgi:ribosomal protein S27AE
MRQCKKKALNICFIIQRVGEAMAKKKSCPDCGADLENDVCPECGWGGEEETKVEDSEGEEISEDEEEKEEEEF